MNKKLEIMGYWWLPNRSGEKICGNLVYLPNEGAELTLMGSFRDSKEYPRLLNRELDFTQHEIILGISKEGKLITLFQCMERPHGFQIGRNSIFYMSQPFSVNYIFLDYHFKAVEDIKFNLISVNYSYLDEWVDRPLETKLVDGKIRLDVEQTKLIEILKEDEYKICIGFDFRAPMFSLKEFKVEQEASFLIKYLEEEEWDNCFEMIQFLQNFMTIATMEDAYPLKIRGKTEAYASKIDEVHIIHPYIDIIVCFSKIPKLAPDLNKYNMLFSLDDIINEIDIILPNWFMKSRESKLVYANYFALTYGDNQMINDHFLNIIIALESYHRKNFDNFNMDPEEHQKRVKIILESIPKRYNSWVKYKLQYNEPNLRKRLGDLIEDFISIFGAEDTANDFLDQAVEIRNKAIIHKNEEKSVKTEKLVYITYLLKILFEICLLRDMGFNVDEILGLMQKKKRRLAPVFEYMGMT